LVWLVFNNLFLILIFFFGTGGHFPRVRGIHKGTVIIEYLGNTVLLVADYSPFMSRLNVLKGNGKTGCSSISTQTSARQTNEMFIGAEFGESCTEACVKRNQKCDDRLIGVLLDCGNQGICGATKKEWSKLIDCDSTGKNKMEKQLTGLMKRAAPGRSRRGKCISTIGRHLSCNGKHESMKRVCVCSTGIGTV
jgi:hypothetical protein